MEKIKVLLCDDMDYLCQYFELLLNKEDDIEVVGAASDPKTCIELYREKKPDVTLLDIQMQTDDEGIKVLEMIIEENPKAKVIMLTIHEEDDLIFRALSSGACDYIIKSSGNKIIADSVRRAYTGESSLNPYIAQKLLKETKAVKERQFSAMSLLHSIALLTSSEYKILRMIYDGLSYSEIAHRRYVEDVTIRTQVNKILNKFNKKNMKELIQELKNIQLFDMKF